MASALPRNVDPRLWFETTTCEGRHYLLSESSHILGRMYFYCPSQDKVTRISKYEITNASDESWYFIRGFLTGSEPGPPVDDNSDLLPDDDPKTMAWRASVAEWHDRGVWRTH